MQRLCASVALVFAVLLAPMPTRAAPDVVATILPLQSIAAAVMQGVAGPDVLLPPGASPHAFALRPSNAARLEAADLVVWIGPGLEGFMAKPVAALDSRVRVLTLADAKGVRLLPADPNDDDHDHDHTGADPHLWLDPANAEAMAEAMASTLGAIDPPNAPTYAANAAAFAAAMQDLRARLSARLASVRGRPYIVFHEAYHYFETAFGLKPAGSVTINPERPPGTARVAELRALIETSETICVFTEPQFEPRLIATLIAGTGARTGTLDPIGAGIEPGPDAYARLLTGLADSFVRCLAG